MVAASSTFASTPHYHLVPRDVAGRLAWRRAIYRLSHSDVDFQRTLRRVCSEDILFWINTFVLTYNPKESDRPSVVPFNTWPFQDTAIIRLCKAIGVEDMMIEKSREMGASWLLLLISLWLWHFHDYKSVLLLSRKEDYVDKSGNPDCLFWKLDFVLAREPPWLVPLSVRNKLHLRNLENGSVIDGESTTGDAGRGGRRTLVIPDEFASVEDDHALLAATADVTKSRFFNSTPKGSGNAFYDLHQQAVAGKMGSIRMHWSQHPDKNKGLTFVDGKPTSPWYEAECRRRGHPMAVAQELDIDFLGSDYTFFDSTTLSRLIQGTRPPMLEGSLEYNHLTMSEQYFVPSRSGSFHLWMQLGADGRPPTGRKFVMFADVATGSKDSKGRGASNSVLSVLDCQTKEYCAKYAVSGVMPHDFAQTVVAIAKWFGGAYLGWEANGPGRIFGHTVYETKGSGGLGYGNIYLRKQEKKLSKRISDEPGFYTTKDSKVALLGDYRRALLAGDVVNRCRISLEECNHYVFLPTGGVAHSSSTRKDDPTGARENHADRVIADAGAFMLMKDSGSMMLDKDVSPSMLRPPDGTFAARRRKWEKDQERRPRLRRVG